MIRHAVRLDSHGRSLEALSLVSCLERSFKFHEEADDPYNDKIKKLADYVSKNEAIKSLRVKAGLANATRTEVIRAGWQEGPKAEMVLSWIRPNGNFATVKLEGVIN